MKKENNNNLMEKIVSFAKRKGFVYPSSEIYGGFGSCYDYGPYGVELQNIIKKMWWEYMVQFREDIIGLDSAIFMHPKIWEASGHISGFSDPLTECKNCHTRSRVDHLLEEAGIQADEKMLEEEINDIFTKNIKKLKCPDCGKNNFTEVKKFNLLVKSNLGNFADDWQKEIVYLRGETCQGIYTNYKNVLDSTRSKIPFGIAQIGKVFRNEITARQFIFRTREFEQMEMQYFVKPEEEMQEYEKLKEYRWKFFTEYLSIKEKNLKWKKHDNLVFYAKEAYDIEYNFPFGFKELEGVHARGDYDLTQHSKFSGVNLSYSDPESKKKYMPHIIESSVGIARIMLALMTEAYTEEKLDGGEERIVMKFPAKLAPIKVAVFPLLKNKPELVEKAKEVFDNLKIKFMCEFDDNGNIGKRYRRQDEIGTPFCVTIDFDTLKDNAVTVRDRDTMKQERIKISDLSEKLNKLIYV
ncbi:MAG: glycine--tRNA ligase [Candidatus Staskawiczbacteria bacterium RIFCSPLOWO2_12_FULL_37_15]|uniref:Glycine--tRNA ligase n=1 Tax=Candidatus Staskawiczbacteria bacterium RIFCSPLOWO2_12_FULL_37_15 TaxID=1802218 RepID=A0A1G2IM32_9BACT|nr:MAG: glycine--tRNA ligase [Candidatus Staskawiczbacteria bacterium RIFCSPLOWO2_12_FULL_37_15]